MDAKTHSATGKGGAEACGILHKWFRAKVFFFFFSFEVFSLTFDKKGDFSAAHEILIAYVRTGQHFYCSTSRADGQRKSLVIVREGPEYKWARAILNTDLFFFSFVFLFRFIYSFKYFELDTSAAPGLFCMLAATVSLDGVSKRTFSAIKLKFQRDPHPNRTLRWRLFNKQRWNWSYWIKKNHVEMLKFRSTMVPFRVTSRWYAWSNLYVWNIYNFLNFVQTRVAGHFGGTVSTMKSDGNDRPGSRYIHGYPRSSRICDPSVIVIVMLD